jgi:hypothetical protein
MFLASPPRPTYRCPGESYDIPRGVHLARIAAGFEQCAGCRHRDGAALGELGGDASHREGTFSTALASSDAARAVTHSPLFQMDGVRGVYLNEITRHEAGRIAGAFASCLWDELGGATETTADRAMPPVDAAERTVEEALRRMGCQVIDVGPVTRPCFWFAVEHLRAAGGLHITGSGTDPSGIGLDFVMQGRPCSRGGILDQIEARWRRGYGRASRRPGTQRLFHPALPYEASLLKHFHALRPLRIAIGCSSRLFRELVQRQFQQVACRLIPVETPIRARQMIEPTDPDVIRMTRAVRDTNADLGVLISDDGQQCTVIDDAARLVPPATLLRLLGAVECEQSPSGQWVDLDSAPAATRQENIPLEQQWLAASGPDILCAGSGGRIWFRESGPTCDAILTLVRLLHRLSRSDVPLSKLPGRPAAERGEW